MKWGVVVFPGSNDDRDTIHALGDVLGYEVTPIWHGESDLGDVDAVVLPGGFSYGDYLRCGAIARFARVMEPLRRFAAGGGPVLGICNGFQILCEAGLLPGALVRNRSLRFTCRRERIRVETTHTAFTAIADPGAVLTIPVKHGEGCYEASEVTIAAELEARRRIVFRYADGAPNGSLHDIAGVRLMSNTDQATVPLIDFDLSGADLPLTTRPGAAGALTGSQMASQMATKLDLARGYIDLGVKDGARELLEEVMRDGTREQRQAAVELMKQIER